MRALLSRLGVDDQIAFAEDLGAAYRVDSLDATGLSQAAEVCRRYRDLELPCRGGVQPRS
jgi:hypothetical protein